MAGAETYDAGLRRELGEHSDRLNDHDVKIRDIELWRAQIQGSLKTLTVVVSFSLGLPATILGLYTLITLLK